MMSALGFAETWDQLRVDAFKRRDELTWPAKLGLAFLMAAVTGVAAQLRFPLPYTEVPVTGQTFAVLLSAVLLGGRWGGLSQTLYVGLGVAGVPWLAGCSGIHTWGYLIGFIVAAAMVGWVCDHSVGARRFGPQVGLMLIGTLVILAFGAVGYHLVLRAGPLLTLQKAVIPFLIGDLIKVFAAAGAASVLLPKQDLTEDDG